MGLSVWPILLGEKMRMWLNLILSRPPFHVKRKASIQFFVISVFPSFEEINGNQISKMFLFSTDLLQII